MFIIRNMHKVFLFRTREILWLFNDYQILSSLCPQPLIYWRSFKSTQDFTTLNFLRRYNLTGIKKRKESGVATFNVSSSLDGPPFPGTFWMTGHSGWIFYPWQTASTSTTSLADNCLTSISVFSAIISPYSPFTYRTVIFIRKFFCMFSQSQLPGTTPTHLPWSCSLKLFRTS